MFASWTHLLCSQRYHIHATSHSLIGVVHVEMLRHTIVISLSSFVLLALNPTRRWTWPEVDHCRRHATSDLMRSGRRHNAAAVTAARWHDARRSAGRSRPVVHQAVKRNLHVSRTSDDTCARVCHFTELTRYLFRLITER